MRGLTHADRRKIDWARDGFLIALEDFQEGDDVQGLIAAAPRKRVGGAETFLFDQGIPMLNNQDFRIVGEVQPREGLGVSILDAIGLIKANRKVRFRLGNNAPQADLFKWKVKNDDNAREPRGEITDHGTRNDPEETKYNGHHFVECYAIRFGVCIGRGRQDVLLQG